MNILDRNNQWRIQDFLIGVQIYNFRGFDLLFIPDYLLFFLIFLKIIHENGIFFVSKGGGV